MSEKRRSFRKSLPLITALALVLPLLFALAGPAFAQTTWWADDDNCPGPGAGTQASPFCTIQAGVDAAGDGDTIYVYPGNYPEGVDLGEMGSLYGPPSHGNLTLVTVNNAGNPTPGTVTVENPGAGSEFDTSGPFDGDLTIDGFNVHSINPAIDVRVEGTGHDHNVEIRNVTATNVADDGIYVSADGNVTIADCNASNNQGVGIWVENTDGDVTITNCTTNQNGGGEVWPGGVGIVVFDVQGQVRINNCTSNENLCSTADVHPESFADCGDGVYVEYVEGPVTISNCTINGNERAGVEAHLSQDSLSITHCVIRGNTSGVQFWTSVPSVVNASIVCGNSEGMALFTTSSVNAEGNWWGCKDGPGAPGCDTVHPYQGTVDFTPWIDDISASASSYSVMAGEPTEVSFQFSGGPPAVYLGEGPGDLRGPAPFTVSTDNGTLNSSGSTIEAFINEPNGVLKVILVPHSGGTATVTVDGPCGLHAFITLGTWEFVPEPGSVVLLSSGLVGLAGYAGIRLRRK